MKVGLLKSGLGWVDSVERMLLNPGSKPGRPSEPQDKSVGSESGQKGTSLVKESKEEFDGPDTSSLTAFLLSLLSCSETGVRCADDQSADDYYEARDAPAEASTSTGQTRVRKNQAGDVSNKELVGPQPQSKAESVSSRGRTVAEDVDESEWQLVSEHDMAIPAVQLPAMSEESVLLKEDLRSFIYSALPTLAQGRQWVLLYSTRKHGMSLLTLYRRSAHLAGPCLLVAGDSAGAVFGGLLMAPLKPTPKKKYQGTSESFVFTNVSGKPKLFRPTGINRYFCLCMNDSLAFGGGGHFALSLDGELLNGSSGSCETYGSHCLAHSEEFTLKHVELWGFAHSSKYLPRQASFKEQSEAPGVCRW